MRTTPLEAQSSRDVLLEPEEEYETQEERDISYDGQEQEEEEDIFNPTEKSCKFSTKSTAIRRKN